MAYLWREVLYGAARQDIKVDVNIFCWWTGDTTRSILQRKRWGPWRTDHPHHLNEWVNPSSSSAPLPRTVIGLLLQHAQAHGTSQWLCCENHHHLIGGHCRRPLGDVNVVRWGSGHHGLAQACVFPLPSALEWTWLCPWWPHAQQADCPGSGTCWQEANDTCVSCNCAWSLDNAVQRRRGCVQISFCGKGLLRGYCGRECLWIWMEWLRLGEWSVQMVAWNNKIILRMTLPPKVSCIIFITPVRECNSALVSRLFWSLPWRWLKMLSEVIPLFPGACIMPPMSTRPCCWMAGRCAGPPGFWVPVKLKVLVPLLEPGWLEMTEMGRGFWCDSTRAASCASCSVSRQMTWAATLWWTMVLLSSPMMLIPNSYVRRTRTEHEGGKVGAERRGNLLEMRCFASAGKHRWDETTACGVKPRDWFSIFGRV